MIYSGGRSCTKSPNASPMSSSALICQTHGIGKLARSIEDFFAQVGIYRERSARTPSVCSDRTDRSRSSSVYTRASWSRATSRVASRATSRAASVGRAPRAGTISPPSSRRAESAARNILDAHAVRTKLNTHTSAKKRGPRKWPRAARPSSGKQVGTIKRWMD